MTAFQAGTIAADLATGPSNLGPPNYIHIQNLGPNPIYVEIGGGTATVTGSTRIANGDSFSFPLPVNARVSYIAETANQSSPNDTRVQRT